MSGFDCKSVLKLKDFEFLHDGFNPAWLNPCCDQHKSMLIDFALVTLLKDFKDECITSGLYLRLLQKIIDIIRQQKLKLDTEIAHNLLAILLDTIVQRDEKIAYEGIATLEKYLRMHIDQCEKCCSTDCTHMQDIQNKFIDMNDLRIKIKSPLMTCFMNYSKEWKPSPVQLKEQYNALGNLVERNQAVLFIVNALDKHSSERDTHLLFLKDAVSDSSTNVFVGVKEKLLPKIFKRSGLRTWFLNSYDRIFENPDILALLSVSLQTIGFNVNSHWSDFISEETMIRSLLHSDCNIRITAFRLLCYNRKPSTLIKLGDLDLVEAFVLTHMNTVFPTMRNEIFATLKKFLMRISTNIQLKSRTTQELLKRFQSFIFNLHEDALDSLLQDANFSRRIMSLTILGQLHVIDISNGQNPDKSLYNLVGLNDTSDNSRLFDALLANLDYSYDLVQSMALDLIEKINFKIDDNTRYKLIESLLKNADNISTEVQHKVTFQAKVISLKFPQQLKLVMNEICSESKKRIENASLSVIASNQPIHPLLNTIAALVRYVSFEDSDIVSYVRENIIELCFDVAKIVDPVLQNVSPEGMLLINEGEQFADSNSKKHIPELISEQKLESQTLLVGCWRTLKAVSSIFSSIVELAPEQLLLNEWRELLPKFKEYFWSELTVCRHRGVFELAARGFQIICDRYSKLFDSDSPMSPLIWLNEVISEICAGNDTRLCSTRRSAGLPLLIGTILKSYQPIGASHLKENVHLNDTLNKLCESAESVSTIHCVNVLKSLLHNTTFSRQLGKKIEQMLLLTLNGLNSSNWSVRNAYSQLFSVLIIRIFGSENFNHVGCGITLREFSASFPLAYEALLKLLSCFDSKQESTEPIVQPVLALLSHIKPSILNLDTQTDLLLSNLHNIVFGAKRETVRLLAIQSITSILNVNLLFDSYSILYEHLMKSCKSLNNNALTSLFQLIKTIVEKIEDSKSLTRLMSHFDDTFELLNDYTAFHQLCVLKAAMNRGFSFNLDRIFEKFKPKEGQFSASIPLLAEIYTQFCVEKGVEIPFDQFPNEFSLSCIERVLITRPALLPVNVAEILMEGVHNRNFSPIRRIIDLLSNDYPELLTNLTEKKGFGEWMTDHELQLFKLNLGLIDYQTEIFDSIFIANIGLKTMELIERKISTNGLDMFIEKQLGILLQHEEVDIRNKAASLISSNLCPLMDNTLNSTACWLLKSQKEPEFLKLVSILNEQTLNSETNLESYEADKEMRIFEPIPKNTFVETFVLKREVDAVNYLVKKLELLNVVCC